MWAYQSCGNFGLGGWCLRRYNSPVGTAAKIQRFALLVGGALVPAYRRGTIGRYARRSSHYVPTEDRWRRYGGPLLAVEINRMAWRKSSASGGESCVEVAAAKSSILIRDSKDPHGSTLTFSGPEWALFLACMHKRRT